MSVRVWNVGTPGGKPMSVILGNTMVRPGCSAVVSDELWKRVSCMSMLSLTLPAAPAVAVPAPVAAEPAPAVAIPAPAAPPAPPAPSFDTMSRAELADAVLALGMSPAKKSKQQLFEMLQGA